MQEDTLLYERIFGQDFVGVGGKQTTEDCCELLNLQNGAKVLDIGCGIGGSAFYLAEKYDANVLGIDILPAMIEIAREKLKRKGLNEVKFEVGDATKMSNKKNSFDVVFSRDSILHIPNKRHLFTQIFNWLKPGGQLLISDYCCGSPEQQSTEFKEYVKQRGYTLLTVQEYDKILEKVGFYNIQAENKSDSFLTILQHEVENFENQKDDILKTFTLNEFNSIVESWKMKIKRCKAGEQQWALFYAIKP